MFLIYVFGRPVGDALIRCNSNDVVLGRALRADAPTRVYFAGIYST